MSRPLYVRILDAVLVANLEGWTVTVVRVLAAEGVPHMPHNVDVIVDPTVPADPGFVLEKHPCGFMPTKESAS